MEQFNETISMSGKTDTPRPFSIDLDTFAKNWDRAFGTRVPSIEKKSSVIDDEKFEYLTELHSGMFYEWYPNLTGEWEKDKARWYLSRQMRKSSQ